MNLTLNELKKRANENYPKIEQYLGVKFDLSLESIRSIESAVAIKFKQEFIPDNQLIVAMGIYLGEVIEKNILNAKWIRFYKGDLNNISLVIEHNKFQTNVFPIVKMNQFWHLKGRIISEFMQKIITDYNGQLIDEEDVQFHKIW